jgi:hypothetical protein
MYNPFSVKALGMYFVCSPLPSVFKVENFDLKEFQFSAVISIIYPSGNLSGLFFTASFILFVSTF